VLGEREEWDPERDRVVLLSNSRDFEVLMNGVREPEAATLTVGRTYRLRLMNITVQDPFLHVELTRDGGHEWWRPIAKDGFDLPSHQRKWEPADHVVSIGETLDMEYTPREAGDLRIEVRSGGGDLLVEQPLEVVSVQGDVAASGS